MWPPDNVRRLSPSFVAAVVVGVTGMTGGARRILRPVRGYVCMYMCVAKPYDLSCGWCLIPIGGDEESMQYRPYEVELKGGIFSQPLAFDPKDVGTSRGGNKWR